MSKSKHTEADSRLAHNVRSAQEAAARGECQAFAWCVYMARLRAEVGHDGPEAAFLLFANIIDIEASRRHPAEWAREKELRGL